MRTTKLIHESDWTQFQTDSFNYRVHLLLSLALVEELFKNMWITSLPPIHQYVNAFLLVPRWSIAEPFVSYTIFCYLLISHRRRDDGSWRSAKNYVEQRRFCSVPPSSLGNKPFSQLAYLANSYGGTSSSDRKMIISSFKALMRHSSPCLVNNKFNPPTIGRPVPGRSSIGLRKGRRTNFNKLVIIGWLLFVVFLQQIRVEAEAENKTTATNLLAAFLSHRGWMMRLLMYSDSQGNLVLSHRRWLVVDDDEVTKIMNLIFVRGTFWT